VIALAYTRYELLRTFRNRRFLIFSLAFPLILYYVIAAPNRGVGNLGSTGVSLPLYYMVGLASFGTMAAMISTGARIAGERTTGWTRQLRITPLSTRAYFRAKVLTAYATALLTIVVLYSAGISLGVSMPARYWLEMTGLVLVGLLPFAVLGILLGHLLTVESMGPAIGGVTSLLALVSGTWFPLSSHGFLHDLAQVLPSYWLVQANRVPVGGAAWGTTGWLVVAVWTVLLTGLARFVYRRDTARV
jgi:ABC-2 type transport system permease protein